MARMKPATAIAVRPGPEAGTASPWLQKIDQALKREETWRRRAKKVVARYRDERDKSANTTSRVNILWSNTEVLKAALYVRTAKPDVRRRFTDAEAGNGIARTAAEVVERGLSYVIDINDIDSPVLAALDDYLLSGRGTLWWSYEPEVEEAAGSDDDDGDTADDAPSPADADADTDADDDVSGIEASVGEQKLIPEEVYWEDFCHGLARTWKKVPWVARRHTPTEAEFEAQFPDAVKLGSFGADFKLEGATDSADNQDGEFVEVWEIWAKAGRKRIYIARGYADILQEDDDPYHLSGFFPCPRPLYSVTTTDRLTPQPEFLQYQDQANELDTVSTRITRLMRELKWNGIYDETIPDGNVLADFPKADDGEFLPFKSFNVLRERGGGIEAAFGFRPLDKLVDVVVQLAQRRAALVQEIYEITGISDIVRGSTDPRETKGAQQLKAQFGSMRMQKRQREVQRFIREAYQIGAEIIAEHFTTETLAAITGLKLPTLDEKLEAQQRAVALRSAAPPPPPQLPAPANDAAGQGGVPAPVAPPQGVQAGKPLPAGGIPTLVAPPNPVPPELVKVIGSPSWDEVVALLRDDRLRSYRIDVETDTTVLEDSQAQQEQRTAFMAAMNDMLEKAYLAAVQAPMMLPLIRETFMFGIRSFKVGRVLEQAAEDAFNQLVTNPPEAPPGKDAKPDTGAADAAKLEAEKARLAIEAKKADNDNAAKLAQIKVDADHKQASLALEREKMALEQRRHEQTRADNGLPDIAAAVSLAGEMNRQMGENGAAMAALMEQNRAAMMELSAAIAGLGSQTAAVAQGLGVLGAEVDALVQAEAAPVEIVRGADGKAVGVRKGSAVRPVVRQNGRVVGLQ